MNSVIISPAAERDIDEILSYLYARSQTAGARVLDALDEAFRGLAHAPESGHQRDDLADRAVRCWVVFSYVIIYRSEPDAVRVVRLVHGARDFSTVLLED